MSSGSKIYNVGVIGYGLSAKIFHIPFINHCSSVRLHAIVQRQPKKDDDCRVDWPGVKHYPSAEELVGDGSVDLVVVTTTPATHFALASLAIQAGKHGTLPLAPCIPFCLCCGKLTCPGSCGREAVYTYE